MEYVTMRIPATNQPGARRSPSAAASGCAPCSLHQWTSCQPVALYPVAICHEKGGLRHLAYRSEPELCRRPRASLGLDSCVYL